MTDDHEVRLAVLEERIAAIEKLRAAQREGDQLAIDTALKSAKELADKHNDLIRAGETKDATYALKTDLSRLENWQARMTGALILVAAIGLGNFIKVWTG